MENNEKPAINQEDENISNAAGVPKGQPQGEGPAVKEGDSKQQRPSYGGTGGNNTSSAADQLPVAAHVKSKESGDSVDKDSKASL